MEISNAEEEEKKTGSTSSAGEHRRSVLTGKF